MEALEGVVVGVWRLEDVPPLLRFRHLVEGESLHCLNDLGSGWAFLTSDVIGNAMLFLHVSLEKLFGGKKI